MNLIQIGTGKMGLQWLDVLVDADGITLAGIGERNDDNRKKGAEKTGLPNEAVVTSVEEALDAIEFDAAVVVTPPASHREIAEALMRAGKHVLMEKPLATTLDDARAMAETAKETGTILMVAQNYRYYAPFVTVRSLIESGAIGAVRSIAIHFARDYRNMFEEGDFRYEMEHVLLIDMSIHHFDMLRALTGRNASRIYAQSWHVPDGTFQHDATANVLITLEEDIHVSYEGSWAPYIPDTSWNGDWDIIGELGRLEWRDTAEGEMRVTLHLWEEPARKVVPVSLPAKGQAGLLADFLKAIESGSEPDTSAADNVHSLGIVLAAVESIEGGKVAQPG